MHKTKSDLISNQNTGGKCIIKYCLSDLNLNNIHTYKKKDRKQKILKLKFSN